MVIIYILQLNSCHFSIPALINPSVLCLQAGVAKLNEAKELVDNLKRKAGEQQAVLAEKQTEADASLGEITETMKVCYCVVGSFYFIQHCISSC